MIGFKISVIAIAAGYLSGASAAELPVKPKYAQTQVIPHRQHREIAPAGREKLFKEFLDWLKKRRQPETGAQ
jgi:hypothetical protein